MNAIERLANRPGSADVNDDPSVVWTAPSLMDDVELRVGSPE